MFQHSEIAAGTRGDQTAMRRITCPHCGRVGKLGNVPKDGERIRCSRCQSSFTFLAQRALTEDPSELKPKIEAAESHGADWNEVRVSESFERRLAALEKRNRILTVVCGALGLLGVAGLLFHLAGTTSFVRSGDIVETVKRIVVPEVYSDEIFAKRVHVVDEGGRTLGVFATTRDKTESFASLELMNSSNLSKTALNPRAIGSVDKNGKVRAVVSGGTPGLNEEIAFLGLLDEDGKPSVNLLSGKGSNEIHLYGTGDRAALRLGTDGLAPFLRYSTSGSSEQVDLIPK